jgi:tetratricopeptide (TPR) repeat protein
MQADVVKLKIERAMKEENYKEALKNVRQMLRMTTNDPYYWTLLAKLQMFDKQYLAAKQSVAKALQLNASFAWGHSVYAMICAKQKNHKEAFETFEFAIKLEPENMHVLYDFAEYLLETRIDLDKAERFARRRIILDSDLVESHELHGRILMAANELAEADQVLRNALRLDPMNEKVYIALARLELFHKKNAFAAVELLRRALMIHPDSMYLRKYFNQALNDKNSLYGFLWSAGLLYGANVKWNWFLFFSIFIVPPLFLYIGNLDMKVESLMNLLIVIYVIYCVYSWSSRTLMRLLLERKWLN